MLRLIADDHDIVRSGLRAILSNQPRWEVITGPERNRPCALFNCSSAALSSE